MVDRLIKLLPILFRGSSLLGYALLMELSISKKGFTPFQEHIAEGLSFGVFILLLIMYDNMTKKNNND